MRDLARLDLAAGLRALWRRLAGDRLALVFVLVLAAVEAVLAAVSIAALIPVGGAVMPGGSAASAPWPMDGLVELVGDDPSALLATLAALLLAKVAVALGRIALTAHVRRRVWRRWARLLVEGFLRMPYARWVGQDSGELINLVGNELNRGTSLITTAIGATTHLLSLLSLLVALLLVDWRVVAGAAVVGVVVYVVGMRKVNEAARGYGTRAVTLARAAAGLLAETMQGVRDIRLLRAEEKRLADVDEVVGRSTDNDFKLTILQAVPANAVELALAGVLLAAGIALGSVGESANGSAILPVLLFFVVALFRLSTYAAALSALQVKLVGRWPSLVSVLAAMESTAGVVASEPRHGRPTPEAIASYRPAHGFFVRDLSFRHGDAPVLDRVALDLPLGSVTYLFGPSGSGKSTLADLLARLHEPSAGSLLVDGRDAGETPIAVWRSLVGYVSQEPVLFAGTLADNVAIGRPEASRAEIEAALAAAGALEIVEGLPQGLATRLAERGRNFSGGQRCRIAIARALIRDPALVILDESTGGLEGALEADIVARLRARPGLAVLVISHRRENAAGADQVVALEGGRLRVERPLRIAEAAS
ncbi:ATP-binding cassette domain-containing protein [Salinarimonas sp.]|uniref:ATP-binding cassette domain-containing protein n=1 Tax=Salinarimonas sp. TaxID=2766526 RepID=UPI0032D922C4